MTSEDDMKILVIIGAALLMAGCKKEAEYGVVQEILTCTDSASWRNTPKCRVMLEEGKRATVISPVAVGDTVGRFDNRDWYVALDPKRGE